MRSNPRPDFPKLWIMRIMPVSVRSCSDSSLVPCTQTQGHRLYVEFGEGRNLETSASLFQRENGWASLKSYCLLSRSPDSTFLIIIFFNDCPLKSNRNTVRILLVIYQNHDELICFAKFSENTCALRYYRWTFSEQYFLAG